MAYREKVWNANVLTDLLSTYLSHKSQERDRYYQAELKKKPVYQKFGNELLELDPTTGEWKTVMRKPRSSSDYAPVYDPKTGETRYGVKGEGQLTKEPTETKEAREAKKTLRKNVISIADKDYKYMRDQQNKVTRTEEGRRVVIEPTWDIHDPSQNVVKEPIRDYYLTARTHPERWVAEGRLPAYSIEDFKKMAPEKYKKYRAKYIKDYPEVFEFENTAPTGGTPKPIFNRKSP